MARAIMNRLDLVYYRTISAKEGSLAPALQVASQRGWQTFLCMMRNAKSVKNNSRYETKLAPKSIVHCMWNEEHFCRNCLWSFRQPRSAPFHWLKLMALAPPILTRSALPKRDEL